MNAVLELIARHRVVPVIVAENSDVAVPLAQALTAGGLPLAEVTFRTPAAEEVLRRMAAVPGMVVGAGTVLTPEQVDRAAAAGAQFIVSPGLSQAVVDRAIELAMPVVPGVATPTELMLAMALGLPLVKFFPAATLGGPPALKALSAPFPTMRFIPTGGVTPETLPDYLAVESVTAVGGSWIAPPKLLAEKRFSEIQRLAAAALTIATGASS